VALAGAGARALLIMALAFAASNFQFPVGTEVLL